MEHRATVLKNSSKTSRCITFIPTQKWDKNTDLVYPNGSIALAGAKSKISK